MTELSNQEKIELMKIALQTSHEHKGISGIESKTAETLVKDYFTLLEAINPNDSTLPKNIELKNKALNV